MNKQWNIGECEKMSFTGDWFCLITKSKFIGSFPFVELLVRCVSSDVVIVLIDTQFAVLSFADLIVLASSQSDDGNI